MEAIILAGGLGTRLRSTLPELPKAMAPVLGRPFLEHLLDHLEAQGVTRAILAVGYRADAIQTHFGTRYRRIELDYSFEESPLGTGGGIRLALDRVHEWPVLTMNGDTLFLFPLQPFFDFHRAHQALGTLALRYVEDCGRYGRVHVTPTGWVTGFQEKQVADGPGWINGGVYLFEAEVMEFLDPPGTPFSLESLAFPRLSSQERLAAAEFTAPFLDIGIPEDFAKSPSFIKDLNNTSLL